MMEHETVMDMDKTKLNTSEVSCLTGKVRATIKRHAEKGKVSYDLDENGHMLFDASEVRRVYANEIQQAAVGRGKSGEGNSEQNPVAVQLAQDKLIVQYEARIDHLEKTLDKALNIAGLLEDRSSEKKELETLLEPKLNELANQTERQMAEQDKRHQEETKKWKTLSPQT